MTARELLDIAAEYVEARQDVAQAQGLGVDPVTDLDTIAARWELALDSFLSDRH